MAKDKKKDIINIIFKVSAEELSERFTYAVSEYVKRHGVGEKQ